MARSFGEYFEAWLRGEEPETDAEILRSADDLADGAMFYPRDFRLPREAEPEEDC